jgi:hypothetical protein
VNFSGLERSGPEKFTIDPSGLRCRQALMSLRARDLEVLGTMGGRLKPEQFMATAVDGRVRAADESHVKLACRVAIFGGSPRPESAGTRDPVRSRLGRAPEARGGNDRLWLRDRADAP